MMLGQVLHRLSEARDDEAALSVAGDIVRLARVRAAAAAQGQSPSAYIRGAVCRFLDTASKEEWATAMGRMQDDPMPGDRIAELAIDRQLQRDEA